jgi:drug/metabolite transporter (DMT)-like permease
MLLALLIDIVVAWLLVRFVPPGWKQMAVGLVGGWLSAIAGSVIVGLAFGWAPIDMLSRLTVGLLVHPLVIAGIAWLFIKLRNRPKRSAGPG